MLDVESVDNSLNIITKHHESEMTSNKQQDSNKDRIQSNGAKRFKKSGPPTYLQQTAASKQKDNLQKKN
jgi:hypothetical protein